MARDPWANLHVHSMFSLLDGVGSYADYAKRLKADLERRDDDSPGALAATEHGSMRGIVQLQKAADEHELKPVFGVELYVSADHRVKALSEEDKALVKEQPAKERRSFQVALETYRGIRPRWHLTAWALNNVGLRNLIRLSSAAWVDGFYYKPRVDLKLLEQYSEGVAVGTACLGGILAEPLLKDEPALAVEHAHWLRDVFGDRAYVELMPNGLADQKRVNRGLLKLARSVGLTPIATVDTHYTKPKDWRLQDTLLAVQTNDRMSNPHRWTIPARDFWYMTAAEVRKLFRRNHPSLKHSTIDSLIRNAAELAGRCEARLEFDRFAALLPSPTGRDTTPEEDFNELKKLCVEGWHWRDIHTRAAWVAGRDGRKTERVVTQYRERLKRELRVFRDMKFSRYALVVRDQVDWARGEGILVGPGRGSAGGSLVVYLLGITSIDPIEHDLLFERFIAPGRIDLPDIDIDFEKERRQEVIAYMVEKYGREQTAQLTTYSSMKGRGCFRDVARVHEVPPRELNATASAILQRLPGHEREDKCIADSLATSPQCKAFAKKRPVVFSVAERLEGTIRQVGLHAGGVVVAPMPLDEVVPLESRADKDGGGRVPVIALDYRDAQECGLVKLDDLGLTNLTVVRYALEAIAEHHDAELTLADLEASHYDDRDVLDAFNEPSNLTGIFQFDSTSMVGIMQFKVERFEDLMVLNALNRPGPMRSGLANIYAARATGKKKRKKEHPIVERITASTLGALVYQEQVARLFVDLAGYSAGDADKIRKKIGKSEGEKAIAPEEAKFIDGAVRNGMRAEVAAKLFKRVLKFGGYGFNRSHAAEYSALGYWEMLLKVRYPGPFYLGVLQAAKDDADRARYIEAAHRDGVEVLTPDVNESRRAYALSVSGSIRPPLEGIKGVGPKASLALLEGQPYTSFTDLVSRTDSRQVHRGIVTALAEAGALDTIIPNRRFAVENAEELMKRARKGDAAVDLDIEVSKTATDWDERERARRSIELGVFGPGASILDAYADLWEAIESAGVELTTLGGIQWNESLGWFKVVARESKVITTDDGRVASLVLTDGTGPDLRARMESNELDRYEKAVSRASGKAVLVRASFNAKTKQLRALKVYDAAALHKAWRTDELSDDEAQVFVNPLAAVKPRHDLRKSLAGEPSLLKFVGRVEAMKLWKDRKKNTMAFFDVQAYRGSVPAVCFASSFRHYRSDLYVGAVVRIELIRTEGGGWALDHESGCELENIGE